MKNFKNFYIPIVSAFVIIGCGGTTSENKVSEKKKTEIKVAEKAEAPEVADEKKIVEITISAKGEDMMAISYEPKSISIPAGSRVKLTFKNESQAAGMYHNFVLVKLGTGQEIATMGIKVGEKNNFVPKDPNVFASTEVLEMGTTTTLEFDAPPKGSYHYICTYPGHYPNMIGRMNVE